MHLLLALGPAPDQITGWRGLVPFLSAGAKYAMRACLRMGQDG